MKAEADTEPASLDGVPDEELLLSREMVGMAVGVSNVCEQALKISAEITIK
jgi:hypothetical protein